MKLCRVGSLGMERPAIIDQRGGVRDASAIVGDITAQTVRACLDKLRSIAPGDLPLVPAPFRYGPPVAGIGKLVCIGLNYRRHAEETGMPIPSEPIFFLKATSAICGPDDDVVLPRGATKGDWEIELGVVIGTEASYVSEQTAMSHVAGYCIVNDVSERAFQLERGTQWTKGKSCDTFAPLGPWLVTPDEIENPNALAMQLRLNDAVVQDGRTDDLIFNIPQLIANLSTYFTLHPGDVIATGTPSGVGHGMRPPRFLVAGDHMELRIDGLGVQRQRVRAYDPQPGQDAA